MTRRSASPVPEGRHLTELADRLHSAAIHLLRRLRREDAASGLSAPRLSALSVLVFGGPLGLGALAAAEGVRPPTMTRIVQALERQGLVKREPDPRDRRGVLLRATEQGRRLLHEGRSRRVATLARQLEGLSRPEIVALGKAAAVLERVLASRDGSLQSSSGSGRPTQPNRKENPT
jgi:DNA-binding MarR family transcriptional regulator